MDMDDMDRLAFYIKEDLHFGYCLPAEEHPLPKTTYQNIINMEKEKEKVHLHLPFA
jgi:hypothetical protein